MMDPIVVCLCFSWMLIRGADGIQFRLDSKSRDRAECFEEDVPLGSLLKVEIIVLREACENVATCVEVQVCFINYGSGAFPLAFDQRPAFLDPGGVGSFERVRRKERNF
mmetsp:Transcript_33806/g.132846  ORF Transcript_33806/g.132846 Transcript_33806/m.132846 type:complete len:109 (-) Transcript_33806:1026-1352(-)